MYKCSHFTKLYIIHIVTLPINNFHCSLSRKQHINVYLEIEIIPPFPTLPPSAHHDTKTVSVNLFGSVSQIFFSVCNAPIYNHTHKGILMLLYIILQNTIIFYITLNNLCFA